MPRISLPQAPDKYDRANEQQARRSIETAFEKLPSVGGSVGPAGPAGPTGATGPAGPGSTKLVYFTLIGSSGTYEVGAGASAVRDMRSAGNGSEHGVGISNLSTLLAFQSGRMSWKVPSGLGNGTMIVYGFPVLTANPTKGNSFALQRGVVRIICTMYADSFVSPNNDVGMLAIIGGAALTDLTPKNNVTTAGSSGFGVLMQGSKWKWVIKYSNTGSAVFAEAVDVTWDAASALTPAQVEFRIFEATATDPARCDLMIDSAVILTRYWVNPTGVTTPVLPPMTTTAGAIYAQIRNTSTGPAGAYFGDFSVIKGPNDAGTLSP